MQKLLYFFLFTFFFLNNAFSQSAGIIVNEVSNGPLGTSQEWVELLVIGNPSNPTANVDLTGWIYDDNNGDFQASSSGVGIAPGHIIFTNAFNNVPPGSLIIIFNDALLQKDLAIPANDPTDSNNDGVYVLPANDVAFNVCNSTPSIGDTSYNCTSTVVSASTVSNVWQLTLALSNGGDVAQTRAPDGSFFHGFAYGTITAPSPNFPISGNPSFNAGSGSGSNSTYYFGCGDFEDSVNFTKASTVVNGTPGAANTAENQIFIDKIKAGTLDYSNLANSSNCSSTPVITTIITNRKVTHRINR